MFLRAAYFRSHHLAVFLFWYGRVSYRVDYKLVVTVAFCFDSWLGHSTDHALHLVVP